LTLRRYRNVYIIIIIIIIRSHAQTEHVSGHMLCA